MHARKPLLYLDTAAAYALLWRAWTKARPGASFNSGRHNQDWAARMSAALAVPFPYSPLFCRLIGLHASDFRRDGERIIFHHHVPRWAMEREQLLRLNGTWRRV